MVTSNGGEYEDRMTEGEDSEVEEVPGIFDEPRRWSWFDSAFLVVALAHNVAGSVAMYFNNLSDQLYAHEAYRRKHRDFAKDVMTDINKL